MKRTTTLLVVTAVLLAFLGAPRVAEAAVMVARAELVDSKLRLEGSGANPGATISVDGVAMGTADSAGVFKIQRNGFSSPSCQVVVGDGSTSAQATLRGCTPSTPPPSAGVRLSSLTLDPANVIGGNSLSVTVTLSAPLEHTTTFPIYNSNPTWARFPDAIGNLAAPGEIGGTMGAVTIPAGSTTTSFALATGCQDASACTPGSAPSIALWATITARFGASEQRATLLILPSPPPPPPALASLSLNSTAITGGGVVVGAVQFDAPNLSETTVSVASSNPGLATTPASVTMPRGSAPSAQFTVTTSTVAAATSVTISATYGGVTKSVVLSLAPMPPAPTDFALTLYNQSVVGGYSPRPLIQVDFPAPPPLGTDVIAASSSNPAVASVQPSTRISASGGESTRVMVDVETYCLAPGCVGTPPPVNVTIAISWGSVTHTVVVTVNPNPNVPPPAELASLEMFTPSTSLVGGTDCCRQSFGTITLTTNNYPNPTYVTITSSNPAVAPISDDTVWNPYPNTVIFVQTAAAFGNPLPLKANFTVDTRTVTAPTPVTITVSYNGITKSTTLTVQPPDPPPTLVSLTLEQTSVVCCPSVKATITPSGPSQSSYDVALVSSHPAVAVVPATQRIAWGATSAVFFVETKPVATSTTVTISASYNGVTRTTMLTILPPGSPPPDTVAIQTAEYDRGKQQLSVAATSSQASAKLTVHVAATGELIGALAGDGSGRFKGQFNWPTNPSSITVKSSAGGSATASVVTK